MKIAILMSTYNGEKYIKEQINSVLQQQGDFELDLYVRDDKSNDRTIEIINEYSKKGMLYLINGTNLGPAKSFMELMRFVDLSYDFYAFSDQDDFWYPDKIKKTVEMLKNDDLPSVCFSNADVVNDNLQQTGFQVYKKQPRLDIKTLSCAGGILGCTMVFNRKMMELIKRSNSPIDMVMHDFYVSLLCKSIGGKIVYCSDSTMKYRQHNNNVIGVSRGKKSAIKSFVKQLNRHIKISIADQAESILQEYRDMLSISDEQWLIQLSNYRNSIFTRIRLSCSRETKYISLHDSIMLRMLILLGNR